MAGSARFSRAFFRAGMFCMVDRGEVMPLSTVGHAGRGATPRERGMAAILPNKKPSSGRISFLVEKRSPPLCSCHLSPCLGPLLHRVSRFSSRKHPPQHNRQGRSRFLAFEAQGGSFSDSFRVTDRLDGRLSTIFTRFFSCWHVLHG